MRLLFFLISVFIEVSGTFSDICLPTSLYRYTYTYTYSHMYFYRHTHTFAHMIGTLLSNFSEFYYIWHGLATACIRFFTLEYKQFYYHKIHSKEILWKNLTKLPKFLNLIHYSCASPIIALYIRYMNTKTKFWTF